VLVLTRRNQMSARRSADQWYTAEAMSMSLLA
jgi:hypothetical protein